METQSKTNQEDILFHSKLPDIFIPSHLPLHSYCFENICDFSTKPCLINGLNDQIYTYEEVKIISRKVATGFHKLGIKQGDTIMLLLPNSPEFVFAFFGASLIGAISTMANPFCTSTDIIKQSISSNTKLIITQLNNVPKIKEFSVENKVTIMCIDTPIEGCLSFSELYQANTTGDSSGLISGPDKSVGITSIDPDDVVTLPYSSGTTGLPKGVMLTHKGLVTNVAQQVDGENPNLYFESEDVLMCALPLFHIYALNSILLCGLRVGASILLMQRFDLDQFLELVQKYKVTICPIVPPVVLAIAKCPFGYKYDLSSIRCVMSGAAPLGQELEDVARAKFPNAILGQGYGMTEAGPVLSMCLGFAKSPFVTKSGSCGTVVRNAVMKIIDPETGASLDRNQPGEICIRGDQIMKGYLNDSDATKRTIDIYGWLHTGDIGYIDDDDEIFIIDRLKELIKYKGFQVAPAELEALLMTHPQISDAAVVPMKDEVAGEVPVAFVVRSSGSTITEDEIKQFVYKQVIFFKRINLVFFVDFIPKSPSGKILRKDLRARLSVGSFDGVPKGVDDVKDVKVVHTNRVDVNNGVAHEEDDDIPKDVAPDIFVFCQM